MSGTKFTVEIRASIPERLKRIEELANDLYYSWNRGVRRFLRRLDGKCWDACGQNPRVFIRRIRQHKLDEAANDPILLAEYRNLLSGYDTYLEQQPVTRIDQHLDRENDLIAYFSAEFGFHESVPIYAGGLGILAGDYCKAMSNLWVPFVGVGLLYRQGYFTQHIDCDGIQIAHYPRSDPKDLPVSRALDKHGNPVSVSVDLPGRKVMLKVWQARVGHIHLLLLDSDEESNSADDRLITAQLYGGDNENRIQQEIALGIGGVRALHATSLTPTVWHINEGHAAFLVLERCRELVIAGLDFPAAWEQTAGGTVFTTHTPVPAGHDVFLNKQMKEYFKGLINELGIDTRQLLALGANPRHSDGFCTTSLAMRGSRYRNGVSRIHGDVASEMESYLWPDVPVHENPVGHITNGTDVDSYLGPSWTALFEMYMGGGWRAKLTDPQFWDEFISSIPNHVYVSTRQILKANMLEAARVRALRQYTRCAQTRSIANCLTQHLNQENLDTLVIGFARRFATYKRATLIFKDLDRLARLVNDPERPVILIFAGKAHPNDVPGQKLLKEVYEISLRHEFQGRVILLENYNLAMAQELVPGVDVWLNNPEYPLEACGTSGMKAAINGGLNLSVLDGWWSEAYNGENGWAITPRPELEPEQRTLREAQELMNILEYQVIPLYYARNSKGEQNDWVERSKNSMKTVLPGYNTIRMAMDYISQAYAPAARLGKQLQRSGNQGARDLALWKAAVTSAWPGVSARLVQPVADSIEAADTLRLEVAIKLNGLRADDVKVGCVTELDGFEVAGPGNLASRFQWQCENDAGEALFRCDLFGQNEGNPPGGLQNFKIRLYPYHPLLNHPLECGQLLWL